MLVRDEIYLVKNLSSEFSKILTISAIDQDDLNSRTDHEMIITVGIDKSPIIAGITTGTVLVVCCLIIVKLVKNQAIGKSCSSENNREKGNFQLK